MIEGLMPYPEYKESGLTWLDKIPAGWNERRSKYLFREVDRRSTTGEETRLSMSQRHGLIPSRDIEEKRLVSATNVGGKICEPGELVLNRLKAHLGVFALASQRGIVSPDYTVLRPIGSVIGSYFCALYRSPYCGQELRRTAKGIVEGFWRLYTDQFYDIRVPVPPPNEQESIVRFLAHTNHKIDGFIRAKRKLIGLLNEQKQAIIHQAVTRGLDPSVQLKPSGIPWLGDIPKHWEVRRLKGVLRGRLTNGVFKRGDDFGRGTLLVNVADVYAPDGVILPDKLERVRCSPEEKATFRVLPGDMFFVRSSLKLEGTGRCALVQDLAEDAVFECHIVRGRPDGRVVDADFLLMFLRSWVGTSNVVARAKTVTMSTVGQTEISSLPVAVPPLHEQRELLKIVATESAPTTAAIARTEREIALMQEYRARLTTDIITGKLDVREAASRLPEPAGQPTLEEVIDGNEADLQDEP